MIQQSDLDHAALRGIIQPDLQEGPLQPRPLGHADAVTEIRQAELKITGSMTQIAEPELIFRPVRLIQPAAPRLRRIGGPGESRYSTSRPAYLANKPE